MKTYECIAHSGNTGKQIVIYVRAYSSSSARVDALIQARQQFGSGAGAVTIISCKYKNLQDSLQHRQYARKTRNLL